MVVFTCEACNESLKKNKVEVHLFKCRRARHVTCIDCQTDFDRESYKAHTSCISEMEKYSGPGFVPKATANKGAKKQDDWFQRVQAAIDSCTGGGQRNQQQLSSVLHKIRESSNVPRKQAKFVNFCRNSMKWAPPAVIQQAWDLLAPSATVPPLVPANKQQGEKTPSVDEQTESTARGDAEPEARKVKSSAEVEQEKRGKKRKRNSDYPEAVEPVEAETADVPEVEPEEKSREKKKKKKNRQNDRQDETSENIPEPEAEPEPESRKKRGKQTENGEILEAEPEAKKQKKKKRDRLNNDEEQNLETNISKEAEAEREAEAEPRPEKRKKKEKQKNGLEESSENILQEEAEPEPPKRKKKKDSGDKNAEEMASLPEVATEEGKSKKRSRKDKGTEAGVEEPGSDRAESSLDGGKSQEKKKKKKEKKHRKLQLEETRHRVLDMADGQGASSSVEFPAIVVG